MNINRTKDYGLIATLNKPVHDLHYQLYPEYFNKYNDETIKEVFKNLVNHDNYLFLVLEKDSGEAVGYAWIEIKSYQENAFKT